jgi:hypothetical protein
LSLESNLDEVKEVEYVLYGGSLDSHESQEAVSLDKMTQHQHDDLEGFVGVF